MDDRLVAEFDLFLIAFLLNTACPVVDEFAVKAGQTQKFGFE